MSCFILGSTEVSPERDLTGTLLTGTARTCQACVNGTTPNSDRER